MKKEKIYDWRISDCAPKLISDSCFTTGDSGIDFLRFLVGSKYKGMYFQLFIKSKSSTAPTYYNTTIGEDGIATFLLGNRELKEDSYTVFARITDGNIIASSVGFKYDVKVVEPIYDIIPSEDVALSVNELIEKLEKAMADAGGLVDEIHGARDASLKEIEEESTKKIEEIKTTQGMKGDKGDNGDVGPQGPQGIKGDKGDKGEEALAYSNLIHLSFDDVEHCFKNLISNKNKYTSIFDEPFFAELKKLNEKYDAMFSLYVYSSSISDDCNGAYRADFIANSNWLKIGFHSNLSNTNYNNVSSSEAKSHYSSFISNVISLTGTSACIDRMPRLNYFAGSIDAVRAMRDSECGIVGLISSDDSRNSYYFNDEDSKRCYSSDYIVDQCEKLTILSTDMRLDWFNSNFTSSHTYEKPTHDNVYDELAYRFSNSKFASKLSTLVVFTHEWEFYNGTSIDMSKFSRVVDTCRFAFDNRIAFCFPQYVFKQPSNIQEYVNFKVLTKAEFDSTSKDSSTIYLVLGYGVYSGSKIIASAESGTIPPVEPEKKIQLELGTYGTPGNVGGSLSEIDLKTRCRSVEFLETNKGFTISSADTSKYHVAIYMLSSPSLNNSYVSGGKTWEDSIVIQDSSSHPYFKIAVKKISGDFTDSEIQDSTKLFTISYIK
ncbi:MAG: hypothetical protein ACRCX2_16345 [Paraclostridium sp.]